MKLSIALMNIHGLIRGKNLEIGRDADNGGQTRYVHELAEYLSKHPKVKSVHIFTRLIDDPDISPCYAMEKEIVNDKFEIHRIPFAGKKYQPKEYLWNYLDDFVSGTIEHMKKLDILPDWIHSHYGDGGYAAVELSKLLKIPFCHTGHSLGIHKKNKLLEKGYSEIELEKKFNFKKRINAEESVLSNAEFIITSTHQEIQSYESYSNHNQAQYQIIPPGININKFQPYYGHKFDSKPEGNQKNQRQHWVGENIEKFLTNPHKPVIIALSRPDRHKNLRTLIEVYGKNKELQSLANLVIFAGIRKDILEMPEKEKSVLTEILLLMDKYDLYGKLAIPKKHDVENEIATIYSYCAEKRGVFASLTLYENFGLTIIEAASSGLPVVATKFGGPSEIIPNCQNGILVNPLNELEIKSALVDIITNKEVWRKYSDNGISNVRVLYNWPSHVETYLTRICENLKATSTKKLDTNPQNHSIKIRLKENIKKLIICDIDGTLLHPETNNPGLKKLLQYINNRPNNIAFALASGRSLDSINQFLKFYNVPTPDILISSVGTEIYYPNSNEFHLDKKWCKYIGGRWKRDQIFAALKDINWLHLQGDLGSQNQYKISFDYKKSDYNLEEIKTSLGKLYYLVNIISSQDKYLDIIPRRASKGKSIKYICRKWNIPIKSTFAAGDSGNDIDMFMPSVKSIIVKNHTKELIPYLHLHNNYLSQGIAAEGVLEGLKHFKVM
jgi:sucrose-phosphate synthase